MQPHPKEEELKQKILEGDVEALKTLFAHYYEYFVKVIKRLGFDEDLVRDAMLTVLARFIKMTSDKKLKIDGKFENYFSICLKNECQAMNKKEKNKKILIEILIIILGEHEIFIENEELIAILHDVLAGRQGTLSASCQEYYKAYIQTNDNTEGMQEIFKDKYTEGGLYQKRHKCKKELTKIVKEIVKKML